MKFDILNAESTKFKILISNHVLLWFGNWYLGFVILKSMLELYYLGQIALGFMLGGILGWQREQSGRAAGPRTYALVTAGAALITILAKNYLGAAGIASHVIGQIITGIGFIGAGTIIHHDNRIEGVTTAAGLWITTAIGIAVGFEAYILSIGVTFLSLGILIMEDKKYAQTKTVKQKNKILK